MSRFMKYLKDNWWDIGFVILCLSLLIVLVASKIEGSWLYTPPRLRP